MRVLIVSLSTYTSEYNRSRLDKLARDVELEVVTGDLPTLWGSAAEPPRADYKLHVAKPWLRLSPALAALRGVLSVGDLARPDLVHIDAEPWQLVAFQGVLAARRQGATVGIAFAENGPAFRGVDGSLRRLTSGVLLRRCSYAVGWAAASTDIAVRLGPPGLLTATIPGTGVDLSVMPAASPESLSLRFGPGAADVDKVAFAGRVEKEKGVLDALAVFDAVQQRRPLRVAIAGRGRLDGVVNKWASSRPWARVHGVLERPEVAQLFACADVVVFPSQQARRWSEQLGKAAVEALAVGTPVVAYDSGALADVVAGAGAVVPEGDVRQMTDAVERILDLDHMERAALSERARVRSRDFDEGLLAKQLVALWREALGASR